MIDLVPQLLKDPVTTAQWESRLEAIARRENTLEAFMADQVRELPQLVAEIFAADVKKLTGSDPAYLCPQCGKALRRREGAKGAFWGCSGYPECRVTLPDEGGKPGAAKAGSPCELTEFVCPKCGKPLELRHSVSKKSGRPYDWYGCSGYPACRERFFARDGKPDFEGK